MEILLWLVPAAVVTLLAALWAAYAGRRSGEDDDPETRLARIGEALKQDLHRHGR